MPPFYQDLKLIINRNPQPLKYPRCRVPRSSPWNHLLYCSGQLRCGLKKPFRTPSHQMGSDSSGRWFFAQSPEDIDQFLLGCEVHQVCCSQGDVGTHSHVERTFLLKTEAAVRAIELVRRNAKVHQNPVK